MICKVEVCSFEIELMLMMVFFVFFRCGMVVWDIRKILFRLVVIIVC